MNYFVTAIGTDSGKTLTSTILVKALQADYWKPIQSGLPKDEDFVKRYNPDAFIHPSQYYLKKPASPHDAAREEGINLELEKIMLPQSNKPVIVEGAGGVLVPLNQKDLMIDLCAQFSCEIIVVCNYYLGSINHTLLTLNEIDRRGLVIKGLVFNGPKNELSKEIILQHYPFPVLLEIEQENQIDAGIIEKYARKILI